MRGKKYDLDALKLTLARHSSVAAAERELLLPHNAIVDAFRRRGESAAAHLAKTVPNDHRVRSVTITEDAAGAVVGRSIKTERASEDPPKHAPVPEGHVVKGMSTYVDGTGQVRGQWIKTDQEKAKAWDVFWAAAKEHAAAYQGLAQPVEPPELIIGDFLTLYPLGDPHIGMLSWARETGQDFDLHIASRDLYAVVDQLIRRSPPSRRAVLANLGDFFHIENDRQSTPTGGNKLDGDGRLVKFTEVGFGLMRRLVDGLLRKHEQVEVVNLRGNHDPMMACMLALWLRAVYEREPRVTVLDNVNPFSYVRHGRCLLGFAHGDGAKIDQLGPIMAADRKEDWGETEHRFWATGHVHHQQRKEFPGCVIESFRTLAAADYWHHHQGYRSGQSLCSITFDAEYGEDVRITVSLRRARETAA